METSREDVGIVIRSAFLRKGTQQKFSLLALILLSCIFIFADRVDVKPLNYFRSFVKDTIYRGSLVISYPTKSFNHVANFVENHTNLYSNYQQLKEENNKLKSEISTTGFL